ncbi:MAG: hypothetical protein EXR86_11945 [Gammaproteobacteria bacterium]|nr:hypothetical protein [Gammaproteobacteria bacterium]
MAFSLGALTLGSTTLGLAYPLDSYEVTGIGRLEEARRVQAGELPGTKQPAGGLLTRNEVDLRLTAQRDLELPLIDPQFTRQIVGLLGGYADRYAIAVLDLSDPTAPRYAEHQGNVSHNPGSVGKLLVALGIFQALADLYPTDLEKRWQVLKDSPVIADEFVISDSHTVRRWDRATERLIRRPLQPGDPGTLLENLDWMLSASSNSAAGSVMKHGMLLKAFGTRYPVSDAEGKAYFREHLKSELSAVLADFVEAPVTRNGLDLTQLRQGSFFTRVGKQKVQGKNSYATARELMKFMLRLEQGRLVDEFSSRELKRLLYSTERRIRYASAPALFDSAVYFKSGSLFGCQPEPDFVCRAYQGNVRNFMNSTAIIEGPAKERRVHYIVTLMSNVLRRNSAADHQSLAAKIHRLMLADHPAKVE